jgi:chromosome segregation ATPase
MAKRIKMKDLLKESFSGTMMGGVVSRSPFHTNISLSKIVKEKYGEVEEQEVDIKGLTTEISSYNKLSEAIFGKSNITQVAEKLSWIASQAKSHTLQETEDWFDKITVNRNMKELTGLSGQFSKIANEAKSLQERMGALYEDMGNILGRYYEIGETVKEETGDKEEYQKFFNAALKKYRVSSPDDLDDEKKKDFYNYVDANWKGDNESD